MSEKVTGKMGWKHAELKSFRLSDGNFYNVPEKVRPYVEKINKDEEVVIDYEKKNTSRTCVRIARAETKKVESVVQPKAEVKEEVVTAYKCKKCGKELKDNKYDMCYDCNQKEDATPEKQERIMRGNALNAAGAALAGNLPGEDVGKIGQALIMLAQKNLDWLKQE
jgi:hypothetical protein